MSGDRFILRWAAQAYLFLHRTACKPDYAAVPVDPVVHITMKTGIFLLKQFPELLPVVQRQFA